MSSSPKWWPPISRPLQARDHVSSLPQIELQETSSASAFELAGKRVFVAGHTGMAGSAIVRRIRQEPCTVLLADRSELDLTRQDQTERYLSATRPDVVIMAAGRVGGILANDKYPATFLADNLAMALNCIHASHLSRRAKTLVPRIELHLPKICQAAHERRSVADRSARADERMVCHCKNRWHQALPGIPPPIRPRFHIGDAHQSLWTGRQLSSRT